MLHRNRGSDYLHIVHRFVVLVRLDLSDHMNCPHASLDPAKYRVFAVQPLGGGEGDEELTAVGVRATVGHTEYPSPSVLQLRVNLVLKILPINTRSASAGSCRVSALDHEVLTQKTLNIEHHHNDGMSERLRLQQVWD